MKHKLLDKALSIFLIVSILGALGMLGYVIAKPDAGERFTEFYILGLNGQASDYPASLKVGEEGKVVVGIINREHKAMNYRLEVSVDNVTGKTIDAIVLQPDAKWEQEVGFTPDKAGDKQKVEFLLYRQGESDVYREVYLLIDIR